MRDYNFFDPYLKKKGLSINFKSPVLFFFLVLLLILGASGALVYQNMMLNDQKAEVSVALQTLYAGDEYKEAETLTKAISAMSEYDQYAAMALEKIEKGSILGTAFFERFTSALPSTVSLTNLDANTASASFSASVPTRKAAAELLLRMEATKLFQQIRLNSVVTDIDNGGYSATFDGVLKAGESK